jgi:pSer/pThr/pTyr-binding forkhead associated (FHA) protein
MGKENLVNRIFDGDSISRGKSDNKGEGQAATPSQSKARITTQQLLPASAEIVDVRSTLTKVPPGTLGLFIVNSGDLILIESVERIILGRQLEDAGTSISLDLTPYGGIQSGVSRRHAVILIYQDMHVLQDLGSTNGTWLNAVRLPPNSSHVLRNGDIIQLGQIRLQAVFHGSKLGQLPNRMARHLSSQA